MWHENDSADIYGSTNLCNFLLWRSMRLGSRVMLRKGLKLIMSQDMKTGPTSIDRVVWSGI